MLELVQVLYPNLLQIQVWHSLRSEYSPLVDVVGTILFSFLILALACCSMYEQVHELSFQFSRLTLTILIEFNEEIISSNVV
ncbi:hypothetical protein BpHYR1_048902 [Brachionus plicatilis]|uniref:Uncharacterized protein n=1 Tax=Brachionus plicatilis TaxID=10195 RepID=A0A3M7SUB1_BRAPC|nr:hypothetical protein BpHYR1_048902 [Brachionus plicatilis]